MNVKYVMHVSNLKNFEHVNIEAVNVELHCVTSYPVRSKSRAVNILLSLSDKVSNYWNRNFSNGFSRLFLTQHQFFLYKSLQKRGLAIFGHLIGQRFVKNISDMF